MLAVLDAIAAQGVDRIVCLGDLVGYHANPNECVRLLAARGIPCVRGNHDAVAAGLGEPIDFTETARHAIRWTQAHLMPDTLTLLRQLPVSQVIDDQFLMVHGALHPQPNELTRLNSADQARESFRHLASAYPGLRICFFGHTHHPAIYELHEQRIWHLPCGPMELKNDAHYLVNPGSVGQSRGEDWRASFLVFDSSRQTIQFHRIGYDWRLSRRKAQQAGLLPTPSLLRRSAAWLWHHAPRPMRRRLKAAARPDLAAGSVPFTH